MGGIYEVRRWDWIRCIYTEFHEDWFRHSEADRRGIHRDTDRMEMYNPTLGK
jgi:hypothetical protein